MKESLFYRFIEYVFSIIVILILFININWQNKSWYMYQNDCRVPNYFFLILFLIIVAVIIFVTGSKACINKNHGTNPEPLQAVAGKHPLSTMKIIGILSIILFIVQIFYSRAIYFETGWDCRELVTAAQARAFDNQPMGDLHYFSVNPNNVFLAGVMAIILKLVNILGFNAIYYPLILVICMLVTASGFFFADCIRILTGRSWMVYVFWGLFVFMTGLSPWITIPYSDTYSIFFATIVIWLFVSKKDDCHPVRWTFITLAAFIGSFIKPTVLLAYMVIVFFSVLHYINESLHSDKKAFIQRTLYITIMVILGVAISYTIKSGVQKYIGYAPDKNKQFTITHYLMMGSNFSTGGGYSQADVNYSSSFDTVAERTKGDLEVTISRYKEMFPNLIGTFLIKKALTNFNDGTFAWGHEGSFFWTIYDRDDAFSQFIRDYIYWPIEGFSVGSKNHIFVIVCQAVWFITLCFTALIILKSEKTNYKETVIITTMMAIICFLMVFEPRARYLFLYSPVIYMVAALGLNRLLTRRNK